MSEDEQKHTRTIDLAPTDEGKAWYGGIAAGAKAAEFAKAGGDNWDARIGLYWLHVGTSFLEAFPDGTSDMHAQYVSGAALNAPTRPQPLVQVTIPMSLLEFYSDEDSGEVNERALRMTLESILPTVGGRFGRDVVVTGVSKYDITTIEFNL